MDFGPFPLVAGKCAVVIQLRLSQDIATDDMYVFCTEHIFLILRAGLTPDFGFFLSGLSDEARGLELGEAEEVGGSSPDLDLPIEDLDLSERPRNCLKRAQVDTVGQLLEKTEDDLLAVTNFGQKSLDEVIEKLDERGLTLRVRV